MTENVTTANLRIVCTACLKVATVHHVELRANSDAYQVIVECHDKAIIAHIDHERVVASRTRDITLQDLTRVRDAHEQLRSALDAMKLYADRADHLSRFIADRKTQHGDEVMQHYEGAAMALMKVYQDYKAQPQ